MKTENDFDRKFESEFQEFLQSDAVIPTNDVSNVVLSNVSSEMTVSPWIATTKITVLHTFATLALIYICPQFGVSWGNPSISLMNFFMKFGHEACAALCGAYLVGGSFLLTALALKPHESFWLKKQMPWVPICLSILTLIVLVLNGATAHHTELVIWIVFAIMGAWAFFEVGRFSKLQSTRLISKYLSYN